MNVYSLLKYLQPLRDKNYPIYLKTLYYYVPIENIDVHNGIITLNTGHRSLTIKQLAKVLLQQDDYTHVIAQYKIAIFHVVAIEILFDMVAITINHENNLW